MNGCVREPSELPSGRKVLALGVFDGVHRGHQEIFRQLRKMAERTDATPVALFFEPHPKEVVAPPGPVPLTSCETRLALMRSCGVEEIVALPFTRELSRLAPEEFLETFFVRDGLEVMGFCVGENWRFGRGNAGDPALLADWSRRHNAETIVVPSVLHEGEPISSTRIRHAVQEGNLAKAEAMLGHPHRIGGVVRHGWGNGHAQTRFPTANLDEQAGLFPPKGVYAGRASVDGKMQDAIVYVGDAPSIRKDVRVLLTEVHLLEAPAEEQYGKFMTVEFWKFLREERLFQTAEELSAQIQQDIEAAKTALTVHGTHGTH